MSNNKRLHITVDFDSSGISADLLEREIIKYLKYVQRSLTNKVIIDFDTCVDKIPEDISSQED